MRKVVGYACTRNLYDMARVSIFSLLQHNPDIDEVIWVIEDDSVPFELDKRVRLVNYDTLADLLNEGSPNYKGWFSYMSLARLCFAAWFPEIEQILWLDTDTLVTGDITGLWDKDYSEYAAAAVQDVMNPVPEHTKLYVNTGVCMFNLKYIREHGLDVKMIADVNSVKRPWADQDVVNIYCVDRIYILPVEYNDFVTRSRCFDARILHWAGVNAKTMPQSPKYKLWQKYERMCLGK